MKQVWRSFWAQRSRWRVVLAVVCVAAALVMVGLVYVPTAWLAQAGAAIQVVGTYLVSFGTRAWLFAVGGALVVCALLLAVLPRRRPRLYEEPRPSAIAAVSVYVDAENQATTPENAQALYWEVRDFVKALRKEQNDVRADLIYFTDSTRVANSALERRNDKKAQERWMAYRALYRYGFRPVHVSHKPVGKVAAENVVDMELALCAYRRALLGPSHQTIILVANDGDYYPLLYRLHALGHTIRVWATSLAEGYKELEESLGIETRLFGTPEETPAKPGEKVLPKGPGGRAVPAPATPPQALQALQIQVPPVNPAVIAKLDDAIAKTQSCLDDVAQPGQSAAQRFKLLGEKCSRENDIPLRMGISSKTRLAVWVWLLNGLGALAGNPTTTPLATVPDTAPLAAGRLERLLAETASVARAMARATSGDHVVDVRAVWRRVCEDARDPAETDLAAMKAVMKATAHVQVEHYALSLCRCARAAGLLRFKELEGAGIQVTVDDHPVGEVTAAATKVPVEEQVK